MILKTDSPLCLHHADLRVFLAGEVHVTRVFEHHVLILMLEGELCFLEDGRTVTVRAGEYYIQRASLLQAGLPLTEPPTYFYVEFDGGVFAESGTGIPLSGAFSEKEIRPVIEAFRSSYARHTANRFLLNSYMFRIFSELTETAPRYDNTNELLSMVRHYICAEYASPITLGSLAKRFGYHEDYLARLFRARYGVTLYKYLTSVRMEHALWLIRSTSMRVSEIALSVGYRDQSVFYRAFQKSYGAPPQDFR